MILNLIFREDHDSSYAPIISKYNKYLKMELVFDIHWYRFSVDIITLFFMSHITIMNIYRTLTIPSALASSKIGMYKAGS